MKDRKALVAVLLVAVAAVVFAAGSSARTNDHRGGTLKLLAKAAGGTLDPQVNYTLEYWQLYQATLRRAARASRRPAATRRSTSSPTSRRATRSTNGGKTWVFNAAQGDQVLERPAGDGQGRRRVVPAHLQGEEPDLRQLLRRHRRRDGVPEDAGHVHAQGRRERQRQEQHRDDQPDGARPRVQVQARGPARVDPAGELAAERRGHEADPDDGRVLLRVVRPEQGSS